MKPLYLAPLILGFLFGCATPNWKLSLPDIPAIDYVYGTPAQIHSMCQMNLIDSSGRLDFNRTHLACAVRFPEVCRVYLPHNPDPSVKMHEEMHCKGWTHE